MGLDYSYSQPSPFEVHCVDTADNGFTETEWNIMLDQAEIESRLATQRDRVEHHVVYPPQPDVEFGFPSRCYCGAQPVVQTCHSINDPGRRFYTCANRDNGECHVWKWWDLAVMEELGALSTQSTLLSQKVDSMTPSCDDDTEQNLARLEKICGELGTKQSRIGKRDEVVAGVMVLLLLIIAIVVMLK